MNFAQLFAQLNGDLTRYLKRLSRSSTIAEDIAQQAWLRMLDANARGVALPADKGEFRAVLFTAARNVYIDSYKRAHFEAHTTKLPHADLDRAIAGVSADPGPEPALAAAGAAELLGHAVERLPEQQRETIRMWSQGLDVETMARRSNAPRDTVLSRKKYAFAKLRVWLEGVGLTAELACGG
ncbi:MAG TPA: sigma-70 family RNA polymerase sigma factor [Steroidobacteraceae bacterium]|jgi:RNA polymerase sigma factor (sigma-70 family)